MKKPRQYLVIGMLYLGVIHGVVADGPDLVHTYQTLIKQQPLAGKLAMLSATRDDRLSADVYGLIDFPFSELRQILQQPLQWCEFMTLNLNIKTCLVERNKDKPVVVLYVGRKYYQPPGDSEQIRYRFDVVEDKDDFLGVELFAASGPMGTGDYRIKLAITPYDRQTLLHVHSAYTTSFFSRLGTNAYLATLGRDKVGFSITGLDKQSAPILVTGVKGIIERNAVRYYLALTAALDTLSVPDAGRREQRSRRWYDLTMQFKKQLYELDRDEYLSIKRREYANQQKYQRQLAKGVHINDLFVDDF
ncbi:MAG: hypothetical protein OEZ39_07110 [Gammaproteobacteria bacterium]|nr:hypothetical protein [Gammaproteobacteria bacterium]MDH5651626.1 hypothetical protein [Gammaproteobacteria bacterium]